MLTTVTYSVHQGGNAEIHVPATVMQREEIEECWPLVLRRKEQVLAVSQQVSKKNRSALRIDRAALVDAFAAERDFNVLAHRFGVSPGSINNALSRLIRIARDLERTATLASAAGGKRYVVIVPVDHEAEGEYVRNLLAQHELRAVLERLDENDEALLDVD